MSTFTFAPDYGARASYKPLTRRINLGDGYSQRSSSGINARIKTWNLSFSVRDLAEKNAILAFLEAANGVESFDWTDPDGLTTKFICEQWDCVPASFGTFDLTATFEQVFE